MALTINNNLMANNVNRNLSGHYSALSKSTQRLSSGLRVNSAADDAAGLAIRELMRADIAALNQGVRNANDGISMIQTADGALGVIDSKLIRMKELAEQASTSLYTDAQRELIDDEYQAMAKEITRIAEDTDFNGQKLLKGIGTGTNSKTWQSGDGADLATAEGALANAAIDQDGVINVLDPGNTDLSLVQLTRTHDSGLTETVNYVGKTGTVAACSASSFIRMSLASITCRAPSAVWIIEIPSFALRRP